MFSAHALLPNLLMIHALNTTDRLTFDYPSWSISAEMFVYLLFPVFMFTINRLKAFALALPFLLALAVAGLFSLLGLGDWTTATFNGGALRAVPSFVAGMLACRLIGGPLAGLRAPVWLAHVSAFAAPVLMLAGAPGGLMLVYMFGLVILLAAAEPGRPGVLSQPWARALANASYGVYLLHGLVAPVILGAMVRALHWPRAAAYPLAPVALLLTTALAVASFRYFEAPARRYFGALPLARRLREPSPRTAVAARPTP